MNRATVTRICFSTIAFLLLSGGYFACVSYLGNLDFFPALNWTKADAPLTSTGSVPVPDTGMLPDPEPKICIPNARVHILMYHYVRDPIPQDAKIIRQLSVPVKVFEGHMKAVRKLIDQWSVYAASLGQLETYRKWNCYPNRNVFVFTDDDGWIDAYTQLAPIAKRYGIQFGFGIITSKLTENGFVNEKEVVALSKDPLFTIASHSVHHGDQDTMPEESERREICDSKTVLEKLTGKAVNTFIYPAGRISGNSAKLLRECGYDFGFSTQYGLPWAETETHYDINRTRVYPETHDGFFEKLTKDPVPEERHDRPGKTPGTMKKRTR